MNRVVTGIAKMKDQIANRIATGLTTQAKVDEARTAYDMQFDEYCKFQELKSLAVQNGTLTLDEGQTVYGYLGNTPEHYNKQPVEVKAVLTKLYAQLLEIEISRRRSA